MKVLVIGDLVGGRELKHYMHLMVAPLTDDRGLRQCVAIGY